MCMCELMVRKVVARSKELATNQKDLIDHPKKELCMGVTGNRQMSVGSAQENQGAHGLSTENPR